MAHRILLAAYVALLAVVGFFPQPVDRGVHGQLEELIAWFSHHDLGFVTYARIEFNANILLFVPFGALVALLFGLRRWWIAPLLCCIASIAIETGQGLFLPERVASIGDVISNTIGGALGTGIAIGITVVIRNRTLSRGERFTRS